MRIGKIEAVILAIGLIVAVAVYVVSDKIADSIRVVPVQPVIYQPTPTPQAVIVVEPVQVIPVTQEPVYIPPTYDATAADFFNWQTAQADRSTGRIGEGTPTPAIGSRDMSGDTHVRTP